jgi:hypothetical protein
MSMLRFHIKLNQKLVAEGKSPRSYPRYIVSHKGPNRLARRTDEAKLRHKGDTPHGAQKRKPHGWRRKMRNARR